MFKIKIILHSNIFLFEKNMKIFLPLVIFMIKNLNFINNFLYYII